MTTKPQLAITFAEEEESKKESNEVFQLMDIRDEEQIVATLEGRYLDEFVYCFCRRCKKPEIDRTGSGEVCTCKNPIWVVGLSWLGIQEASREHKGLQVPVEKVQIKETDTHYEVMLEAIDIKSKSTRIGVATQPKYITHADGSTALDIYAKTKAVSKAQRNALRTLLPQTLIKRWIEKHRKKREQEPAQKKITKPKPQDPQLIRITDLKKKLLATGIDGYDEKWYTRLLGEEFEVEKEEELTVKQKRELISRLSNELNEALNLLKHT